MSMMVWTLKKGNIKIYTKKIDVAKKAIKDGYFVSILREKPHIYKKYKPENIKC